MRVAIVGNYPINSTHIHGGVQAAFSYLVEGLRPIADLDLHILTIRHGISELGNKIEQEGATVHFLPALPRLEFVIRNYRTYQARLDRLLAQIKPDLVHAQDAVHDAYVALRSGYPTVITVHGIKREEGRIGNSITRLRNRIHSVRIEERNLRHARHLIAISRYVSDYFASTLRPDANVYYIPNAINHLFFELEDKGDGVTILFMGHVIQRKRPLDLVKAFARIAEQNPQAQLRIAGSCRKEAEYAESVRNCIQHTGLNRQVHLLGPLSEDKVLEEFARCDILALPSIQETTPMVIAQAMAAGKPVVATSVGGVPEMVDDGQTGFLVDVGDIKALACALRRLLQNPTLRADMGQAGTQKAEANYRASVVARRTYQVYQSITAGS